MDRKIIAALLKEVADGTVTVDKAIEKLLDLPYSEIEHSRIDHHRALRTGYPEVIFCQNKSVEQIEQIVRQQIAHDETVFGTRASELVLERVQAIDGVEIHSEGRCFWCKSSGWKPAGRVHGTIVIAAAGTADSPVVEEARSTVEIMGHPCTVLSDVGVSGIHRLFDNRKTLRAASVIIVVAGMEGALPSVVAGFVAAPVIGVPTSVGYGSHLNGLVPMLAMLNSCSAGLTVVNIDNGFGAGHAAVLMNTIGLE
jgi:hypothetical protein